MEDVAEACRDLKLVIKGPHILGIVELCRGFTSPSRRPACIRLMTVASSCVLPHSHVIWRSATKINSVQYCMNLLGWLNVRKCTTHILSAPQPSHRALHAVELTFISGAYAR